VIGFCDSPGRCVGEDRWGCCVVNVVKQHRSELRRGRVRSDQTLRFGRFLNFSTTVRNPDGSEFNAGVPGLVLSLSTPLMLHRAPCRKTILTRSRSV
jgi:hypothetical protein